MAEKISADPIQKHLEIGEIRDDVVILKSKALRAVLMTNSINFFLKSAEEQKAVILRYQDFLNSLDFSIQIVVNSRKFDISQYTTFLKQKAAEQENELLKIQTLEYVDFVKGLTQLANIMTDSFYVIIPYSPSMITSQGLLDRLLSRKKEDQDQKQDFEELKNSLWQRVNFVTTGLRAMGVNAAPLKTNELTELFYKLYNPGAKEKITAFQSEDQKQETES